MTKKSLWGTIKFLGKETCTVGLGLFVLIVISILFVSSTPVFLLRFLIKKLAKFVRPDLSALVSPQGNLFSAELFSSKSPRCSLVVSVVVEGTLEVSEFHRRFTNMVNTKDKKTGKVLYPEYKQYVEKWLGFAFWKNDPHFDVRNHVKLYNNFGDESGLPAPQLRDIVEELLNKRYQPFQSPWESYVVNNYQDPNFPDGVKTLLVMRFHHSLADGFSILYSALHGLLQLSTASIRLPTPTHIKRDTWSQFLFGLAFPILLAHDLVNYFVKGFRKNPFNVPDSKKSWKQIYGRTTPIPIQTIKEIKDGVGVSFTSVLLAAIAASMSTVSKAKVSNKYKLSDRASFFIPLPLRDGHPNALINHVTGAQIDLPIRNFTDPIMRVKDCDRQIQKQKASTIPWMLMFLGKTLGLYFSTIAGVISANPVNVGGLTSFPVSMDNISIRRDSGDGKVLSIEGAAGALIGVAGIAFTAITYGRNIQFSAAAESSVLTKEEVENLLTLLCEEIRRLHTIVHKMQVKGQTNNNLAN